MGTLTIRMDQALADKLRELVAEHVADIKSGVVTSFDWDQATELESWDEIDTAISDAQTDLLNGVRA